MTDLSIKAAVLLLLSGLPCLSGGLSRAYAGDALNGHRLFFSERQRQAVTDGDQPVSAHGLPDKPEQEHAPGSSSEAASSGSRVRKRSTGSLSEAQGSNSQLHSAGADRRSVEAYQVYFTGLITGHRGVQILVNGLPCRVQSDERSGMSFEPLPVDCVGVPGDTWTLAHPRDSQTLLVSDVTRQVRTLSPGEGL